MHSFRSGVDGSGTDVPPEAAEVRQRSHINCIEIANVY